MYVCIYIYIYIYTYILHRALLYSLECAGNPIQPATPSDGLCAGCAEYVSRGYLRHSCAGPFCGLLEVVNERRPALFQGGGAVSKRSFVGRCDSYLFRSCPGAGLASSVATNCQNGTCVGLFCIISRRSPSLFETPSFIISLPAGTFFFFQMRNREKPE